MPIEIKLSEPQIKLLITIIDWITEDKMEEWELGYLEYHLINALKNRINLNQLDDCIKVTEQELWSLLIGSFLYKREFEQKMNKADKYKINVMDEFISHLSQYAPLNTQY